MNTGRNTNAGSRKETVTTAPAIRKSDSLIQRFSRAVGEMRNPVAWRKLTIKANGEAHLNECGVAVVRWVVILIISVLVIFRFKDPNAIIGAIVKLLHFL